MRAQRLRDAPDKTYMPEVRGGNKKVTCELCQKELQVGDWPFCPHGSTRHNDALAFDPILVYQMPDGSYSYPGSNLDAAPCAGAKPILLDSLRKADSFQREVNLREQYDLDKRTEGERNHRDRELRNSREKLRSELMKRGISRANADAIAADQDGRGPGKEAIMAQFEEVARATGQEFNREHAERVYEQTQRNRDRRNERPVAHLGITVFERDASNRHGQRDERTGWREGRK